MGSDEDVERAARVSYGYGTRRTSETRGLVRYLRRHRHTTPSEMVELKFHCAMPIFVARQIIRHRVANVNEYSRRYSLLPLLFYRPAAADRPPEVGGRGGLGGRPRAPPARRTEGAGAARRGGGGGPGGARGRPGPGRRPRVPGPLHGGGRGAAREAAGAAPRRRLRAR